MKEITCLRQYLIPMFRSYACMLLLSLASCVPILDVKGTVPKYCRYCEAEEYMLEKEKGWPGEGSAQVWRSCPPACLFCQGNDAGSHAIDETKV